MEIYETLSAIVKEPYNLREIKWRDGSEMPIIKAVVKVKLHRYVDISILLYLKLEFILDLNFFISLDSYANFVKENSYLAEDWSNMRL